MDIEASYLVLHDDVTIQWEVQECVLRPPTLSLQTEGSITVCIWPLTIDQMWKIHSTPHTPQEAEQEIWEEWVDIFYTGNLKSYE